MAGETASAVRDDYHGLLLEMRGLCERRGLAFAAEMRVMVSAWLETADGRRPAVAAGGTPAGRIARAVPFIGAVEAVLDAAGRAADGRRDAGPRDGPVAPEMAPSPGTAGPRVSGRDAPERATLKTRVRDVLRRADRPLRLKEIAERVGAPSASVYGAVVSLGDAVRRDRSGGPRSTLYAMAATPKGNGS